VLQKKDSKYVRALFSYEAAADIELDLKEGDVVKVDIEYYRSLSTHLPFLYYTSPSPLLL
jgi:hypothetical protein